MKTALITGITGQDGTYLAELLSGKGYRVLGTSRTPQPEGVLGTEVRALDLSDAAGVARVVDEVNPDEIYHLAGQSSVGLSFAEPRATFESIAVSTLSVLEAVRQRRPNARLFVAGSGEIFGDTGGHPATETTPLRPKSPYGVAKSAAAELARVYRDSYGLFAVTGFLYNHESPRRPERFVTRKVARGASEIALGLRASLELGDLSVVRDFGWAPEIVVGIHAMLQTSTPEDFILATGESVPLERFVEAAFTAAGLDYREHVQHSDTLLRANEVRAMHADPSRARDKLGFRAETRHAEVARRLVDAERAVLSGEAPRTSGARPA